MISLAEFFDINRSIIYFVYGLVFFILGFAIVLQTRQSSRLDMARSLRWLAAFGITHGFHEWGDLFIPIQESYLNPEVIRLLYILHLVLLAISFVFLFEFGMATLDIRQRGKNLHAFTVLMFIGWVAAAYLLRFSFPDEHAWRHAANAFARYFIGFPGGLLAAYGLRQHTMLRIKPLNVPNIVLNLQIAGISIGIYSVFAGLIPPSVDFFPGNILNHRTFAEAVGVPPLVFRSLTGLIAATTLIRALEVFEVETNRRIEELEQHQIVTAERERLARELHDGAIQKVYTAGLLVESASRIADSESEIGNRLERSVFVLNDAILDLRRNLTELHAGSAQTSESLPDLLLKLVENPHYTPMVTINLEIDQLGGKQVAPLRSSHIHSIVNEALANTVRHSHAKNVVIRAVDLGSQLRIEIADDGIGIPPEPKAGYGLRNMRDRARLLNGSLEFINKRGTSIVLTIPWEDR